MAHEVPSSKRATAAGSWDINFLSDALGRCGWECMCFDFFFFTQNDVSILYTLFYTLLFSYLTEHLFLLQEHLGKHFTSIYVGQPHSCRVCRVFHSWRQCYFQFGLCPFPPVQILTAFQSLLKTNATTDGFASTLSKWFFTRIISCEPHITASLVSNSMAAQAVTHSFLLIILISAMSYIYEGSSG